MALIGLIAYITNSSPPSECLPPTIIFATIALICWVVSIFKKNKKQQTALSVHQNHIDKNNYSKNYDANENAWYNDYDEDYTDMFSVIDGMDGHTFEYFCADLLWKNGFIEVSVTKGSGDQGVDILATKDGIKYAIQCKNYSSPLGNTPVQEVNAGKTFYNCHVGVVMTNSTFTKGAKTLAQATGILLWDKTILQKMIGDTD
ncbi:MAG: restriction endonuclease [Clostridia bacterium]|nr:restriction endonuclease [Clostridia bacterium]